MWWVKLLAPHKKRTETSVLSQQSKPDETANATKFEWKSSRLRTRIRPLDTHKGQTRNSFIIRTDQERAARDNKHNETRKTPNQLTPKSTYGPSKTSKNSQPPAFPPPAHIMPGYPGTPRVCIGGVWDEGDSEDTHTYTHTQKREPGPMSRLSLSCSC